MTAVQPARTRVAVLGRWSACGGLAGTVAGLVDLLCVAGPLAERLGASGLIWGALLLILVGTFAGTLAGLAGGILFLLARGPAGGGVVWTQLRAARERRRLADPRDAVVSAAGRPAGWAAGAAVLVLLVALIAGYAQREFAAPMLIALFIGLGALPAAGLALLAGGLASHVVAWLLRPVLFRLGLGRRGALVLGLGCVLVLALAAAVVLALREQAVLVALGPSPWIALGVFALLAVGLNRWVARRTGFLGAPLALIVPLLALVGLILGAVLPGPRGAAEEVSGLTAGVFRALRAVGDLDRDGYAAVLGGGDCDDWDSAVHPGAVDTPGDGIDQNCLGGDAAQDAHLPRYDFAPVPDSVPRDLSILLVTVDALRADHMECYGYDRTTSPNLSALAAQGIRFEWAFSNLASTRQSHGVMFTGRHAFQIEWDRKGRDIVLSNRNRTLAEVLKRAGLVTAGLPTHWYLTKATGYGQGFKHYDEGQHRWVDRKGNGSSSPLQADDTIAMLETLKDRRFFLWSHFYDPHANYETHPEHPFGKGKSQADRYDSEVAYADAHLGRVLTALNRLGLAERTLVVVTGDHGDGLGDFGIRGHTNTNLRNILTRVPMILRVPGLPPRVAPGPVSHVDLPPTLLNLLRLPPEPQFAGQSFVDQLTGGTAERFVYQSTWDMRFSPQRVLRKAIIGRGHKLFVNLASGARKLFDLDADPDERTDLWHRELPVGRELEERLQLWVEQSGRQAASVRPPKKKKKRR